MTTNLQTAKGHLYVPSYDVDWSAGRVRADKLDRTIVDEKFKLWDSVVEQGLAYSSVGLDLLEDDTIYAYANLQFNGLPVKMRYFQDAVMSDKHRIVDVEAANQQGKEQPVSAKVLTPSGWRKMGDIFPGMFIVGQDGKPHKVLNVFPQGVKDVYRLTFEDGSTAECGLEHLWKFQSPNQRFRKKDDWTVATLKEIIDIGGYNPINTKRIAIPVCEPVHFTEKRHIIHPYILGALLGDGMFNHYVGFTTSEFDAPEIISKIKRFIPDAQYIKQIDSQNYRISSKGYRNNLIKDSLRDLGLWGTKSHSKFIPQEYLLDSIQNRIELLRGLMDTDGTIGKDGVSEFYSVSKELAQGVQELVQSLGGKARIYEKPSWYKDAEGNRVDCQICYRVKVKLESINPFFLSRKAEMHRPIRYRKERILHKIELVREEESKCIMVDSDDHTYITNNYVVTHNTFTLCVKAAVSFLRDHGKNWTIALVSRSKTQNGTNMRMIKQMLAQADIEWTAGDNDSQSVTTMDMDGGYTNTIICAVAGGGALGLPVDLLLLDEFEFWVEEADKSLKWYFDQIFYPRTFETKGQIIIYSNPNGKNFVSEDLQKRMNADDTEYLCHTYNINYLDNPHNTRVEWDNALKNVHPIIFASTMAAERTESEGAALKAKDIALTYDENLQQLGFEALRERDNLAFFADLGFVYDQTVLCGGYSVIEDNPITKRKESIFYFVPKIFPVGHAVEELWGMREGDGIPQHVRTYTLNPYFELDLTGKEGNEVLAREAGMSCDGVKMSGPWKAVHYERFISLCKQGRIKVYEQDNWLDGSNKNFAHQASTLKISTKTANGKNLPYPTYHHNTEKDHDDIVDAIVGCLSMIDEDMSGSPYTQFYEKQGAPQEKPEDKFAEVRRLNNPMKRLDNLYGY